MRFFIGLAFSVALSLLFPSVVIAESAGGITVNPAYVDVSLEESVERQEFEVTYKNNSNNPVELEIFPIDFAQTDERGVIGFLGRESGSYEYGLSSFLSFDINNLFLEPGEEKSLIAIVTNRQDLSPGGHYAAIVGRLVPDESASGSATTQIAPAVSSLVYLVKKGGERYNLSLRDISWPEYPMVFSVPSTLTLTFQNEGNVHLSPFGTVRIYDMFGRETYSGSINSPSFKVLPSSRRFIPAYISRLTTVLPVSFMTMEIRGNDIGNNVNFLRRETFLYINPWIGGGLIVFLIVTIILLRKRTRKKRIQNSKTKMQK